MKFPILMKENCLIIQESIFSKSVKYKKPVRIEKKNKIIRLKERIDENEYRKREL